MIGNDTPKEKFVPAIPDFKALFYHAPDASLITGPRGHICMANDAATILMNRSAAELSGVSIVSLVRWKNRTAFRSRMSRLKKYGKIEDWEVPFSPYPGVPFTGAVTVKIIALRASGHLSLLWTIRDISERKQMEEKMGETIDRYRQVSEQIPDILYSTDNHGEIIFIAGAAEQVLNIRPENLVGKNILDLERILKISSSSPGKFGDEIRECISRKGLFAEHRVTCEVNGNSRVFELKETVRYDGTGQFQGISGVLRDITGRDRHDQDFRSLVENSPHGIVVFGFFPFRMVFVNPAMTSMLGYSGECMQSFSPDDIMEIIHPDDREMMNYLQKRVVAGRAETSHHEVRLLTLNGSWKWLKLSGHWIKYKGIDGFQAIFIDISREKRSEIRRKTADPVYRTILEDIPISIFRTTPEPMNRFIFVNPAMAYLLGYEGPAELLATPVCNVYRFPWTRDHILTELRQKGAIMRKGVVLQKKNGSSITVVISARALQEEASGILWIDGILEELIPGGPGKINRADSDMEAFSSGEYAPGFPCYGGQS